MDHKSIEPILGTAEVTGVTADMRVGAAGPAPQSAFSEQSRRRKRRLPRASTMLSLVAAIVGVTALAASAWIYTETRRETLRLATDLAQVRLSLDLYARSIGSAPAATPTAGTPSAELADLSNRLAILEQTWRNGLALPQISPATPQASAPSTNAGDDCLPAGMRILVAAGDSYPICGQSTTITVASVDNGYISLADGTMVASGGNSPLPGSSCMLGVTSGGDEGLTGYAEIRVTC